MQKAEYLNSNGVVGEGLRGLVSCVQRHLKPWSWGRGRGMDGWVTVWWRRRSKREITLLSLCSASPLSPPSPPTLFTALSSLARSCAPRYSSSNYLKKDILFTFGLFSFSVCPVGKFYMSDQTDSRSAQHSNPLSWFLRFFFFLKTIKGLTVTARGTQSEKKEALLRREG